MAVHRVLVVGAGSIGERHVRCFLATGRARVSFAEVNPELRAAIAARYPGAVAHATLEDAAEDRIDAAVVATPAPLHVPQATQLVRSGAHVLIEKPLGIGLDSVDALADLAAWNRVVVAVGYVMRAQPGLAEMRAAVASGRFGRPLELVAIAGQDLAALRPAYRSTYFTRRNTGGGAVQDALTHLFNAGEWLVGPIGRVVADAAHLKLDGVDVEDTVHVLARHGGVLASYALNQYQAPNEITITVVCERGTARYEMPAGRWRYCERSGEPWTDQGPESPPERDAFFIRQAHSFLDSIEGRTQPLCTLEEGAQTLRVNLATLDSIEDGRWVSLA